MDFGRLVSALLRRWLILLIGLIVSVAAAAAVYLQTPSMYQSTSQAMVLLPRTANSPDEPTSPFLYLPDGLTTLARVVVLIPNTAEFRRALAQDGFTAQYEVSVESTSPIVRFSVEGTNPGVVLATRDELMRRFAIELKRVQTEEQVPQRQFAHLRYLEASAEVDALSGDRLRGAAMAGVLGGVLTLGLIIALERRSSVLAARNKRSADDTDEMEEEEDLEEDEQEFSAWDLETDSSPDGSSDGSDESSDGFTAPDGGRGSSDPSGDGEWGRAAESGSSETPDDLSGPEDPGFETPQRERDRDLDGARSAS